MEKSDNSRHIETVVDLLRSTEFQVKVDQRTVDLAKPATASEIETAESQLSPELFRSYASLLRVTTGFDLYSSPVPEGQILETPVLSVNFIDFSPGVWENCYSNAVQIGVFEELLYWDIAGSPAGRVFFVDHEGPCHCLAFESLANAISLFLSEPADEAWQRLSNLPACEAENQDIKTFEADSDELRSFLKGFPPYYSVHDLRQAKLGAAFPYNVSGPEGMCRWGREFLFVQRQPMNWLESLKWWWNPNAAMGGMMPPENQQTP